MNFQQARNAWAEVTDRLDFALQHAKRVAADPLPINTEDVSVMKKRMEELQRHLERLLRGLS